jgi:phage replication O-like protein O
VAKPQLENGHTRIANEILDAFCQNFPGGSDAQVLLAIIRKTYGWNKKEDAISISQLEEITFLCRRTIINSLQNLEAKQMIVIKRERGRGKVNQINVISLQKNYDFWVVQRKSSQYEKQLQKQRLKYQQQVVQRNEGSAKKQEKVVQRNDKKDKIFAPTKETIQKKLYKRKGGFSNVLLTEEEYQKLIERFGAEKTDRLIEDLSFGIKSKGYKYKDHYATILNWDRLDQKRSQNKGGSRQMPSDEQRRKEFQS